jgi:anti-anti-sigma factor
LLTTDHRLAFRQFVLDALDLSARAGARQVELNLGGVVEIDASGLGILLLAQKRARELGLRLRLVDVPRSVVALLDATRMEPLFDIIRSR